MRSIRAAFLLACMTSLAIAQSAPNVLPQSPLCRGTVANTKASIDVKRSLAISNFSGNKGFQPKDFSFGNTINAILSSAASTTAPKDLVATMLESFKASSPANKTVKLSLPQRDQEIALLKADAMLAEAATVTPIGLFNRFDLADGTWSHCGEHRIVYAMTPQQGKRALFIFEAAVPNPIDANGRTEEDVGKRQMGCRPVAEFWANMSNLSDDGERARKLQEFYYSGTTVDGVKIGPVITADNLGAAGRGQVRANLFAQSPWQLREWRVDRQPAGLVFKTVTVKDNPIIELFSDTPDIASAPGAPSDAGATLAKTFKSDFLNGRGEVPSMVRGLLDPELDPDFLPANDAEFKHRLLSGGGFGFVVGGLPDEYNQFESTSQGDSQAIFEGRTGDQLEAAIGAFLASEPIKQRLAAIGRTVTVGNVLARANAMTCGGCHHTSGSAGAISGGPHEVAPGTPWPVSAQGPGDAAGTGFEFVHITEAGDLSPALKTALLPARLANLSEHLCRGAPIVVSNVQVATNRALTARVRELTESLGHGPAGAAPQAFQPLETAVEDLRRFEAATPGAFSKFRSVH